MVHKYIPNRVQLMICDVCTDVFSMAVPTQPIRRPTLHPRQRFEQILNTIFQTLKKIPTCSSERHYRVCTV